MYMHPYMRIKDVLSIAAGTIVLLFIPFISRFPWTVSDYVVAGLLIFCVGFGIYLALRNLRKYRIPIAILIVFLFAWLWVELAVGLFTNWGS